MHIRICDGGTTSHHNPCARTQLLRALLGSAEFNRWSERSLGHGGQPLPTFCRLWQQLRLIRSAAGKRAAAKAGLPDANGPRGAD